MTKEKIEIYLANPRGFCAGVERAIDIVNEVLKKYTKPIYVKHEIVHNKFVVDNFRKQGVVFVDDISTIPNGSTLIFSAHGVSEKVEQQANQRNLHVIDATCPLVTKVHLKAKKYEKDGIKIVVIGHKNHPEIEGTTGRVKSDVFVVEDVEDVKKIPYSNQDEIAYITQTTLSVDDTKNIVKALMARYPNIKGSGTKDICFATQNRQQAVKMLSSIVDTVIVIGSTNSSNSNRLRDLAASYGITSYLIDKENDLKEDMLQGSKKLGITAGASAPEILVQNVITKISTFKEVNLQDVLAIEEDVKFKLPRI